MQPAVHALQKTNILSVLRNFHGGAVKAPSTLHLSQGKFEWWCS